MALVEVGRFPTGVNAEIARTLLESHNIGAVTFDSGMNIADSAAIAIPVRLMVLEEDYDQAEAILKEAGI